MLAPVSRPLALRGVDARAEASVAEEDFAGVAPEGFFFDELATAAAEDICHIEKDKTSQGTQIN